MTEEQPQRRAADHQIPLLSAKVGHLEATVESQGRWLQDVDHKIDDIRRELGDKLDQISSNFDQKTRTPMLPLVALLVSGAAVLITLGVQAISGLHTLHETSFAHLQNQHETHEQLGVRHKHEFRQHIKDGHSASVRKEVARIEHRLDERIGTVDAQHALENIEQEEDIEALRENNKKVEERLDDYLQRIAVLETRFDRVVGHSSEGFHQKDARQVIGPLIERMKRLEQEKRDAR